MKKGGFNQMRYSSESKSSSSQIWGMDIPNLGISGAASSSAGQYLLHLPCHTWREAPDYDWDI